MLIQSAPALWKLKRSRPHSLRYSHHSLFQLHELSGYRVSCLRCLDQFVQLILQLLVRLDWLRAIAEQRARDQGVPDPERSLFLACQQRLERNPQVLPKRRHLVSMRLSVIQKQGFG